VSVEGIDGPNAGPVGGAVSGAGGGIGAGSGASTFAVPIWSECLPHCDRK
jgi:hypothetical protein